MLDIQDTEIIKRVCLLSALREAGKGRSSLLLGSDSNSLHSPPLSLCIKLSPHG